MGKIIIVNAIIWSALLLAASFLIKGHEHYDLFLGIWVVGFTLVNGYLSTRKRTKEDS